VAFWAHTGGFITGMIVIWLFRNPALVARRMRVVSPYGMYG
jgi:membrane associated rhomboid family serine protease